MNDERPEEQRPGGQQQQQGAPPPPPPEDVHPVVRELSKGLGQATAAAFADESNLAERIMFAGFRGPIVKHPNGSSWRLLYLDLELRDWLLIETGGIVRRGTVKDETVPFEEQSRDVFWVKADAAVGRGDASQAVQAQFLTGKFTRAGDFEAPLSGGTLAAATGVFCEARTPSCCLFKSKRP